MSGSKPPRKQKRRQTWAVGAQRHTRLNRLRHVDQPAIAALGLPAAKAPRWDVTCSCGDMAPVLGVSASSAAMAWQKHVEAAAEAAGLPITKGDQMGSADPPPKLPPHLRGD